MEIFLHKPGAEQPEIINIEETALVRELIVGADGHGVWIEEIDVEIDIDIAISESSIRHHHHVHHNRCREVEVSVRYNNVTHAKTFTPARTVRTVHAWACGTEAFDLSPEQADEHKLARLGTKEKLDPRIHIGSLLAPDSCSVQLELIPRGRHEG